MSFKIDPRTLDFELPDWLIAQAPLPQRDDARLMVLDRTRETIEHRVFADVADYLRPGDVMVLNKAKVDSVKLVGRKTTGGRVDMIFIGPTGQPHEWRALVRPLLKDGVEVLFHGGLSAVVMGRAEQGEFHVRVDDDGLRQAMHAHGKVPLPPYIKRSETDERHRSDQVDYQTVYASTPGSIAAPTAGLHFTPALLQKIRAKHVEIVDIVLHVGWGTFRPIADAVVDHRMLAERYEVSPDAAAKLRSAETGHHRVIAVGTTCTRTLETIADPAAPLNGESALFIKPGFQFRMVDGLITNLHVPRSTPVALTAAFAGLPLLEKAYAEAIDKEYRFYSYGDAMLVL